jgi:hypothetical protein
MQKRSLQTARQSDQSIYLSYETKPTPHLCNARFKLPTMRPAHAKKKTNREEQGRNEDADAMRARPGRSGLQCNEEEEEKQGKKTRKTLN